MRPGSIGAELSLDDLDEVAGGGCHSCSSCCGGGGSYEMDNNFGGGMFGGGMVGTLGVPLGQFGMPGGQYGMPGGQYGMPGGFPMNYPMPMNYPQAGYPSPMNGYPNMGMPIAQPPGGMNYGQPVASVPLSTSAQWDAQIALLRHSIK